MNEALGHAAVPADPAEAGRLWAEYSARWTWWNTLRTLFSMASLLLVGLGLFLSGGTRFACTTDSPAAVRGSK
jgi:uncharacterized membrane protein